MLPNQSYKTLRLKGSETPIYMSDSFLLWLTANEIAKYHQVLVDNDINTIDLVKTLTADDLKELGVSLGDRKRFEKAFLGFGKIYSYVNIFWVLLSINKSTFKFF